MFTNTREICVNAYIYTNNCIYIWFTLFKQKSQGSVMDSVRSLKPVGSSKGHRCLVRLPIHPIRFTFHLCPAHGEQLLQHDQNTIHSKPTMESDYRQCFTTKALYLNESAIVFITILWAYERRRFREHERSKWWDSNQIFS